MASSRQQPPRVQAQFTVCFRAQLPTPHGLLDNASACGARAKSSCPPPSAPHVTSQAVAADSMLYLHLLCTLCLVACRNGALPQRGAGQFPPACLRLAQAHMPCRVPAPHCYRRHVTCILALVCMGVALPVISVALLATPGTGAVSLHSRRPTAAHSARCSNTLRLGLDWDARTAQGPRGPLLVDSRGRLCHLASRDLASGCCAVELPLPPLVAQNCKAHGSLLCCASWALCVAHCMTGPGQQPLEQLERAASWSAAAPRRWPALERCAQQCRLAAASLPLQPHVHCAALPAM